ncbi:MAG: MarR family transcriptional regulator [Candidatus Hodarchaeales archaeon]|jgi:hypothetical protein
MVSLLSPLKDTAAYEPFFMDILNNNIGEQHARILALMFKLGGYTTLNVLTDSLEIAQPTVSVRVEELVKLGLIRKNTELMPMVLVLNLRIEDLAITLERRVSSQLNAVEFLLKAARIDDKTKIKDTFLHAIQVLFPNQQTLSDMVSLVYLNQVIARDDLYKKLKPNEKITKYSYMDYDSFILNHHDLFHVLFGKQRKNEMFIQPRLPLDLFAQNRLAYLKSLKLHYTSLVTSLQSFLSAEYSAITPYQLLKYPSDVKKKVDTCLKNYSTIRIIDNAIYQRKGGPSILELLTESAYFGTTNKKGVQKQEHQLFVLSHEKPSILKKLKSKQIQYQPIKDAINRDYIARDFIIFEHHGCLVVPSIPDTLPYYNIAPQFTETSLNVFESNWKEQYAI